MSNINEKSRCKSGNENNTLIDAQSENVQNDKYKMQPKTCQELWKRCRISCSTINPLDRFKFHENGCCIMSPIPDTGSFKPLFEPLFSSRTSFSYYQNIVEVDQRCTCMKFNGIQEKCIHPDCKNNSKCLTKPSPLCLPALSWKKYYEEI